MVVESKSRGKRFQVKGNDLNGTRCTTCSQRVVEKWNELPNVVVRKSKITTFLKHLNGYMDRKGLEEFGPVAGN